MGPVGRTELRDERLDPLLDCVLGKHHGACDLLVGVPLRKVTEELELARRQRLADRRGRARLGLLLPPGRLLRLFRDRDGLAGAAPGMPPPCRPPPPSPAGR